MKMRSRKWLIVFATMASCVANSAWARTSADEEALKSLLSARSYSQLRRSTERGNRIRHAHLVCDAQLRGNRIPTACFDVVELESSQYDSLGSSSDSSWLVSLCRRRASKTRDWTELRQSIRSRLLPQECRSAAETRLADLQYSDQSEHPAELFRRTFESRM